MSDRIKAAELLIPKLDRQDQAKVYVLIAIAEALERIAAVKEGEAARDGRPARVKRVTT